MPNRFSPGGCRCCNPCETCASAWNSSTFVVSGFSASTQFKRWWRLVSGTVTYLTDPYCSEFDLSSLNGTYVLSRGVDDDGVLTGNVCFGRKRTTISSTTFTGNDTCAIGTGYFDGATNAIISGGSFEWETSFVFIRQNGTVETATLSLTRWEKNGGGTRIFRSWQWSVIFNFLNKCCASTDRTHNQQSIGYTDNYSILGSGGAKINCTLGIEVTRSYAVVPAACRDARITEAGDNLISEAGDYVIPE